MLFLVFLMLLLGLFALFLGGGMVAQGFLYQNPAERMPLRAAAAAALVAGFITLWVWVDRRSPGRYDTLFNFVAYTTADFNEFEAVRWAGSGGKLKLGADGKPVETVAKFTRPNANAKFTEEGTGLPFTMLGTTGATSYMTGAVRIKGPGDAEPVRYNATLKDDMRTKEKVYSERPRFVEEKGSRYVEAEAGNQMGKLFVPSTGTVFGALTLNAMLFVVWLVALWPVMRFSFGHALMFAAALGLLTMLGAMPLLFKPNREPRPAPTPTAGLQSYSHTSTASPAASASRFGGTRANPSAATAELRFDAPPVGKGTIAPPSSFTRT